MNENSVILQVIYDRNGNFSNDKIESHCCIWQFNHLGSLVASWSKGIAFDNYEADTPWFMVTWQEGVNPYKRLKVGFELAPPQLNLSNSLLDSVDYVLTVFKSTEDSSPFSIWLQENFIRQDVEGAGRELALYRRES